MCVCVCVCVCSLVEEFRTQVDEEVEVDEAEEVEDAVEGRTPPPTHGKITCWSLSHTHARMLHARVHTHTHTHTHARTHARTHQASTSL